MSPKDFSNPWPERVVPAVVTAARVSFALHTTHIPLGSSVEWVKIEMLDGIYSRLAIANEMARLLCGDFNTPQPWDRSNPCGAS